MARRIAPPSSDELVAPPAPPAGGGAARAPRRRSGVSARIDRVEGRLRDMPIDSLLQLRDRLEALLLSGTAVDAEVVALLDDVV